MGLQGGTVELRGHDIAQRVALESPADRAAKPVHVLHDAIAIVGCMDAKAFLVARMPGFGQIGDASFPSNRSNSSPKRMITCRL